MSAKALGTLAHGASASAKSSSKKADDYLYFNKGGVRSYLVDKQKAHSLAAMAHDEAAIKHGNAAKAHEAEGNAKGAAKHTAKKTEHEEAAAAHRKTAHSPK